MNEFIVGESIIYKVVDTLHRPCAWIDPAMLYFPGHNNQPEIVVEVGGGRWYFASKNDAEDFSVWVGTSLG